jgi:putative phosphoesterase
LIIHAGDLGDPKILEALKKLAPVTAVRGNVDTEEWATILPPTAEVKVGAVKIYILHNVKELEQNSITSGVSIIVSGHSHKPGEATRGGIVYKSG